MSVLMPELHHWKRILEEVAMVGRKSMEKTLCKCSLKLVESVKNLGWVKECQKTKCVHMPYHHHSFLDIIIHLKSMSVSG